MCSDDIAIATETIEAGIRDTFEDIWTNVTDAPVREYRILIWGSTIETDKDPDDLDIIIEYTGDPIEPEQEQSIEGWLQNAAQIDSTLDPVVAHYLETPTIISNSRVSKVYSVDEEGWLYL